MLAATVLGCGLPAATDTTADGDATPGLRGDAPAPSRPTGVAATARHVFVASASYRVTAEGVRYDPAWIDALDRDELEHAARWPLPLPNPVRLHVAGDDLWVLCMGALVQRTDGTFGASAPGGLVRIPGGAADPAAAAPPEAFPLPPDGAPGSWAWQHGEPRVVLGSAIVPELYVFDVDASTWLFDVADPVARPAPPSGGAETMTVAAHPDGSVAVFSFSRNRGVLLDGADYTPQGEEVRVAASDELEGPIDALFPRGTEPPTAYVVLTLSNAVAAWSPGAADAVDPRWQTVGLSPIAARQHGDELFIVDAGDNALSVLPLAGGDRRTLALPVATGPNDVAFAPDGARAYVSGEVADVLLEIDLTDGTVLRRWPR